MKKIFAIVMSVAMILSLGTLFVAADANGCIGWYADEANFEPIDDTLALTWVANAAEVLNLEDLSLEDWADLNIPVVTIERWNTVAWINDGYVPEEFMMNAQFAADGEFLYVAFNIVDDDVRFSTPVADPLDPSNIVNYNSGDNFQMNIDFGNKISWILENDPDAAEEMTNAKAVFYSFGIIGDGENVYISVQESDDDRILGVGDAVNMNPDRLDLNPTGELTADDMVDSGTKGKTWLTDDGWAAEFRIPFAEMFYDYCYKSYNDGWNDLIENSINIDEDHPLEIGIGLYNLNWNNPNPDIEGDIGGLAAAFGLHAGDNIDEDTGRPIVTWGPEDLCTKLSLAYTDGMEFVSPYLLTPEKEALETIEEEEEEDGGAVETTAQTTAGTTAETKGENPAETKGENNGETTAQTTAGTTAETKGETTAETKGETKAETKAPTSNETEKAPDNKPTEEKGCASVVGFGAVAILTAAAAAVVLKKKD